MESASSSRAKVDWGALLRRGAPRRFPDADLEVPVYHDDEPGTLALYPDRIKLYRSRPIGGTLGQGLRWMLGVTDKLPDAGARDYASVLFVREFCGISYRGGGPLRAAHMTIMPNANARAAVGFDITGPYDEQVMAYVQRHYGW